MHDYTLQAIREHIITLERELDAFRRSEEALRELTSLELTHDVAAIPSIPRPTIAKPPNGNGIGRPRTLSAWIPTVLLKLGRPATVGMVSQGLLGRRASRKNIRTALARLAAAGTIRRVAHGVYEKV